MLKPFGVVFPTVLLNKKIPGRQLVTFHLLFFFSFIFFLFFSYLKKIIHAPLHIFFFAGSIKR